MLFKGINRPVAEPVAVITNLDRRTSFNQLKEGRLDLGSLVPLGVTGI